MPSTLHINPRPRRSVLHRVSRASKCGKECVQRRVPITRWLPRYRFTDVLPDFIAGVTVGLTLIPQSIAYAALAGLEPQYGLYSSFLGTFVYILFGTVKEINLGPAALTSLLTFNYTHKLGPQFAVLLCFLCGCFELICGLLRLGFLMEFVSGPVVSGFTSAAAITIASAQVKGLLGLKFPTESFVQTWTGVVEHIGETKLWDAMLGVACCAFLIALKMLKDNVKIGDGKNPLTKRQLVLSHTIWGLATARNAIVVLLCAWLAYSFVAVGDPAPFLLTGRVSSGLPPLQLPPFSGQVGNQTLDFLDMAVELGPGVLVTSVISIIGNIALGKAFASGRILDATQEMMTLGLCNIAGSMVGSMPVTGSFSRSAISRASGVRSPLAGLYAGTMVLLSLSLLTPYFYFIPRATLSSVIVCAVVYMVDLSAVPAMWRSNKKDLLTLVATFMTSLMLGMEVGIVTGVAIDVFFLLRLNARPKVPVELVNVSSGPEYLLATPSLGLLFPAADHVRAAIQLAGERHAARLPVVLDCCNVNKTDYTAAQGMHSLIKDLKVTDRELVFLHVQPEVLRVLASVCKSDFHHAASEENLEPLLRGLTKSGSLLDASFTIAE